MRRFAVGVAFFLTLSAVSGLAVEKTERVDGIPFPIGEKLHYQIVWGILPVGDSYATTEWIDVDGQRLLAIRIRARSNSVIKKIYPVDSFIETLVDPVTLLPVRYTKKSHEGKSHSHEVTDFDYASGIARQQDLKRNKITEFAMEAGTRDLVSFMYFLRGTLFAKGSQTQYRVMTDDKIYDLLVRAVKEEKVEIGDNKKVRGMRMEPEASFEGLFVRKGRIGLWLSQEVPTLILRVEVDVPLARVKLILVPN